MFLPPYAAAAAAQGAAPPAPPAPPAPQGGGPGMNVPAHPEHQAALNETMQRTVKCVPDYRNREKQFIAWIEEHYPDYAARVVVELTEEQRADKHTYHTATHDLRYHLLEPHKMQLFLSSAKKKRQDGRQYGPDHVRKYHDAILYCAKLVKQQVTAEYRAEMKAYLDTMKKEKKKAKGRGELDEKEADAIGFKLYKSMCLWTVKSRNVMLWAFTVVQWNCMGRSVNVAPLGFHNLSRKAASDSVVIEYDKNKTDQAGENTSPKNCYANPFEPLVCMFLALGCYLCINEDKYNRASDLIFHKKGRDKSAGETYCKALRKLVNSEEAYIAYVHETIRDGHFHPHGTRKGSATHVTTATTDPPPIPSVLLRGEWSLGKVLELYWKWSQLGDAYLGKCLAGLDPDDEDEFGTLPPHFTEDAQNEHIKEALQLCFGSIIAAWSGKCAITGVLMLFLASMVHHHSFLETTIAEDPEHPFQSIPLMQRPELLDELKKLVTLDPIGEVTETTGVPYRIKQMIKLKGMFKTMQTGIDKTLELVSDLPAVIKQSIDEKASESGQVTASFVVDLLERHSEKIHSTVDKSVKEAVKEATQHLQSTPAEPRPQQTNNAIAGNRRFPLGGQLDGRFREYRGGYFVPPDFRFLSVSLKRAWEAWLIGFPGNISTTKDADGNDVRTRSPVRPLRYIALDRMIPMANRARKRWADEWKPVLKVMHEGAQDMIRNTQIVDMGAEFVETSYIVGRAKLEQKYPRLFDEGNREKNRQWKVATWSKKVRAENRANVLRAAGG